VFPAAGAGVRVQLSVAEMTADNVVVRFADQAGAEWCDQSITIQTTAQQIDDLATPATVWDYLVASWGAVTTAGGYILSKLGLIGTGSATVAVPVTATGNVATTEGDDYDLADGRALEWTITTSADFTGGTVAIIIHGVAAFAGTISMPTATTALVRQELTRAQTTSLGSRTSAWDYSIVATQAVGLGSDVVTLLRGQWMHTARHRSP